MARYIDLENPMVYLGGYTSDGYSVYHVPSNTPTVDAVEVVRCRECLFFDHSTDFTFCKRVEVGMDEDDYCSFAERRDDD